MVLFGVRSRPLVAGHLLDGARRIPDEASRAAEGQHVGRNRVPLLQRRVLGVMADADERR